MLDYTSLMDVPSKEFFQDGHVFISRFFLQQSAQFFVSLQGTLLSLGPDILGIFYKRFPTNKMTFKTVLGSKKIIKKGDVVTINSKKVLPLGLKGLVTLKVKEFDFMKGYLNLRTSLRIGEFCSPESLNLKIIGFSSQNAEDSKNIFVKVISKKHLIY